MWRGEDLAPQNFENNLQSGNLSKRTESVLQSRLAVHYYLANKIQLVFVAQTQGPRNREGAHVHNFRLACERHKIIWLWSCTKVPLLADAPPLSKCFHSLCSDCIFAMCAGGVRNMFRAQDKECSLTCCTLLTIESSRKDPHSPHGENFCCPEGEGRQISFWYLY
jgi:hypothetical protein